MRKPAFSLMAVLGLLVAGCSNTATETTLAITTTVTPTTTSISPATTTTEPMAVADPADDSGCVTCHTDQDALMALAVEPVDAESLSTGEG